MQLFVQIFVVKLCVSLKKLSKKTAHYLNVRSDYKFGIRLVTDSKVLIMLNARNDDDRTKFVEDLREAILEVGLVMVLIERPSFLTVCTKLITRVGMIGYCL